MFVLFSYYLTLFWSYFLSYLIKYYYFTNILLYLFSSLYLFPILSSSLFHFSSFFFLFCHFSLLLCFKWVHHVLHLHVIIFSFIPTGLLKILRQERQDHPNYSAKTKVPIPFCFCIIIGLELHGQFYTLFLSSTLRYLTHWKRSFPEPHEGLRYTHF